MLYSLLHLWKQEVRVSKMTFVVTHEKLQISVGKKGSQGCSHRGKDEAGSAGKAAKLSCPSDLEAAWGRPMK